ncbi:liprin-beta-2-like isoform X2 [Lampetra planeri]
MAQTITMMIMTTMVMTTLKITKMMMTVMMVIMTTTSTFLQSAGSLSSPPHSSRLSPDNKEEELEDTGGGACSWALASRNGGGGGESQAVAPWAGLQVVHLTEELCQRLERLGSQEEREGLRRQLPPGTVRALLGWLHASTKNGQPGSEGEDYQERLSRLEEDRESLVLQVSVLTDQVEAQGDKIRELEFCLDEHREKLTGTEEMLQQELLARNNLETQKVDLVTEVSSLKLKITAMEVEDAGEARPADREWVEGLVGALQLQMSRLEEEVVSVQRDAGAAPAQVLLGELGSLRSRVAELEEEKTKCETKLSSTAAELAELRERVATKEREIETLRLELASRPPDAVVAAACKDEEIQKMKSAVESLLQSIQEKDRKISELHEALEAYREAQELGGRLAPRDRGRPFPPAPEAAEGSGPSHPTSRATRDPSPYDNRSPCRHRSNSLEDLRTESGDKCVVWEPMVPHPADKAKAGANGSKYQTLPAQRVSGNPSGGPLGQSPRTLRTTAQHDGAYSYHGSDSSLGEPNGYSPGSRSGSERGQGSPPSAGVGVAPASPPPSTRDARKKGKGIRRLFGRLRRTQSAGLAGEVGGPEKEFLRGGLRATVGPSLGWPRNLRRAGSRELETPFASWGVEQVCGWLSELGLGACVGLARQWVVRGDTLLRATTEDLERELGLKNPLHRKKLTLALQALGSGEAVGTDDLHHTWVTRWLDDVGLPQYKEQFHEARMDGRMLHYITTEDLLLLKVTNLLHHLSIKRAVQVLRLNHFQPDCLIRSAPEGKSSTTGVYRWSNQRLMEWMKQIDLAEYATNLRGSGVHGGLLIFEPRFSVETLASLLSIPPSKTLLRRHLSTSFSLLVGREAQRAKREVMDTAHYSPLSTTAKVKPKRLVFAALGGGRRRKGGCSGGGGGSTGILEDPEELLCPLELGRADGDPERSSSPDPDSRDGLAQPCLPRVNVSEGTVRQIGAFSQELINLTSLLAEDGASTRPGRARPGSGRSNWDPPHK